MRYLYGNMAQMYMFRNSEEASDEISNFIQSIFLDEESSELLRASSDTKKHVLHVLMDKSLPPLVELKGARNKRNYHKLDEKVIMLFKKDFVFLNKDKDSFLNESSLLFKFYYFFYVSRGTLILANMFSEKDFHLYFTLETESVSESRRTHDVGWKTLEPRVTNLFSHTVCLDLLNHIPLIETNGPLDYIGIRKLYLSLGQDGKDQLLADVKSIYDLYYSLPASDMNWDKLEDYLERIELGFQIENEFEQQVFRLYGAIDFQFEKFQRKGKRDGYGKWFSNFCKVTMLKSRGKYGYTLSLSNEMLLFLTKLCTGDEPRIKLKDLWTAFRERGIYFDDYTQQAVLAIYDKINLIEKKSDSGDAQYIRRIL
jgi:DNA phosphorothioation-dependent restriction protein DptG